MGYIDSQVKIIPFSKGKCLKQDTARIIAFEEVVTDINLPSHGRQPAAIMEMSWIWDLTGLLDRSKIGCRRNYPQRSLKNFSGGR